MAIPLLESEDHAMPVSLADARAAHAKPDHFTELSEGSEAQVD